ncbi:molybdate ABC transporter substrate-binding protein [Bacillus massiliglaciei]|uniref:molybdate ABC transporter substrate-binding protein n=1 Tax=Bacillus massiliglaciei TaxID=1816693 RepID=UPI000B21D232|nr:molybdate ABC transporter substrate-binding protein [Bacillus massiliglaciei]
MRKLYGLVFAVMVLFLALAGCSANETKKSEETKQTDSKEKTALTVSAAASLQDALTEIKADFEKEHPDVQVNFNFGGSGALQQQISQGAPVDLFFSAAQDKFQALVDDGHIDKKNGIDLVGNDLVLVVPKGSDKGIQSFEDLTKADKIALGTPESVPAGEYGQQTLKNTDVWKEIEDKVVYGKDVRQVLTYAETKNVDAGIVYKTDALTSDKVEIAAAAEDSTHDPIIYPVGIIKNSAHVKEAQLFYDYLQGEKAMQVLEKYGFKDLT